MNAEKKLRSRWRRMDGERENAEIEEGTRAWEAQRVRSKRKGRYRRALDADGTASDPATRSGKVHHLKHGKVASEGYGP